MTIDRRTLLPYAIGLDLVIVAAGIALLLPPQSGLVLVPFIGAIGVAASRGGWRVGVATTAFSFLVLAVSFWGEIPAAQYALLALIGIAASAVLDVRSARSLPPEQAKQEQREALESAAIAARLRDLVVPLLMYVGLPTLVVVVYLNLSTVLVERFGIPSLLQPLVLILAGLVLLFRKELRMSKAVLMPVTIALAAYCLIVFTSSNWARDAVVSDSDLKDLTKSVMLLVVTSTLAASWRALRGALLALVAAAVLLSILTLIQVAIGDPTLQFGGLAESDQGHIYGEVMQLRPAGPVGDANYLARILILAFAAAAFLGAGRTDRKERLLFVAAAGLIALAILFTYSRGGMLSLAAVGFMVVIAGRLRVTRWNVALVAVMLVALLPTNVGKRLLTLESLITGESRVISEDSSVEKRRQLLAIGWEMLSDRPLAGVGVGNFGSHYARYASMVGLTSLDYTPHGVRQYPHNLYLEIVAETGLVGLFAFLGAIATALGVLYRARRMLIARGELAHAALVTAIAIGLAGYLIASVFLHSGLHRYLWMFLGLAVAACRLTAEEEPPTADGASL